MSVDKILNAIKNQRWFFFENNDKILFDSNTALLWANLDYFPYQKQNQRTSEYFSSNGYSEVKNLIEQTNSQRFGGFGDWRIPSEYELWKMIEDKTFPFKYGDGWKINSYSNWCVNYNGKLMLKFLNPIGTLRNTGSVHVIPCSSALIPNNFSHKPKEIPDIFTKNNLMPKFDDAAINEMFRQIYIVKPEVQRKLTGIQQQIKRLKEVELISPKVDWLALKTKFDLGADASPVRYAESLKNLTEHLLDKFDDYTADKATVLDELKKLSPPNELVPNVKAIRADLESFHEDALTLKASLMKTSGLMSLKERLDETRPPFETVTEILTEKVRQMLHKVEFFELQPEFVRKACAALNMTDRPAQKVLEEMIRYVKAGHLQKKVSENLTAAELALNHLQTYRESVAEIYKRTPDINPPKEEILPQVETLLKNISEVTSLLDDEKERHHLTNLIRTLQDL